MRISAGAKWGALVGLFSGVINDVFTYAYREELVRYAYETLIKNGVPPQSAQQIAQSMLTLIYIGAIIGGLIVWIIVGVILAAVWDRLRWPWYSKGALFGLALALIGVLGNFAGGPAQAPAAFQLGPVLDLAFALLLAHLLVKFGG